MDKPINMGDGIGVMDLIRESGALITSIIENNRQVRSADAGAEVWIGDIKAAVRKGSRVFRTLSKSLFDEARKTYEGNEPSLVPLDMEFTMRAGEKASLKVTDNDENSVYAESGEAAERAIKKALSEERIQEQLKKTGDTPYWVKNLCIETDNDSVMPISALNALRRDALEKSRSCVSEAEEKHIGKSFLYR